MALLANGEVIVGNAEFHVHASSWHHHGHDRDRRYDDVILHVVLVDDARTAASTPTLVLPLDDVARCVPRPPAAFDGTVENVDEIQRGALLRLLRHTAAAKAAVRRVGQADALRVLTSSWFDRFSRKRHHPTDDELVLDVRSAIAGSPLGLFAARIGTLRAEEILDALAHAEQTRIAREGAPLRRELLVNAVLPLAYAVAPVRNRVPLLQWYWSAKAIHSYGMLRRRFPTIDQAYVWQQQGMLELLRAP
jgi:hypothetical protein